MTTPSLSDIFTGVTTVLTNILTYVGNVANFLIENPVTLLFSLAIPTISFGIGILGRLINRV